MEIDYSVSEDGLIIEAFPKGILDIQKTINYFKKIQNDKRINPEAIEIVYFKKITDFQISYLESENITSSYQDAKNIKTIKGTIFVCETDLAYGIGRMLQTFHEITNPDHKVIVTRSENEIPKLIKTV